MTPDEKVKIYNKGVSEGMKHSTPSPETASRLLKLEEVIGIISTDIAVFTQKTADYHGNQDKKLDEIIAKVDYTNGKVRKIIIALFSVASFSIGLGLVEAKTLLSLIL